MWLLLNDGVGGGGPPRLFSFPGSFFSRVGSWWIDLEPFSCICMIEFSEEDCVLYLRKRNFRFMIINKVLHFDFLTVYSNLFLRTKQYSFLFRTLKFLLNMILKTNYEWKYIKLNVVCFIWPSLCYFLFILCFILFDDEIKE